VIVNDDWSQTQQELDALIAQYQTDPQSAN